MTIVAHHHPFVIGVDTHARTHALAILACPTAEVVDQAQFPTTTAGLRRALAWVGRRTAGDLNVLWVIEGTGTYGARLAHAATETGYTVVEASRMDSRNNRGLGKSDPLDAQRIAAAALPLDHLKLRMPRADDGVRAAIKVLLASRDHMSTERTATINALTALLRIVDLGIDARGPLNHSQITTAAAWRSRSEDLATATARGEATRLARRVIDLDHDLATATRRILQLLRMSPASVLLRNRGSGPSPRPSHSQHGHIPDGSAPKPPSPASPGQARSQHPPATHNVTASTPAGIAVSTKHSTWQRSHACAWIPAPAPTSNAAAPKDEHPERSAAVSSATSLEISTENSTRPQPTAPRALLDRHRRFNGRLEHLRGTALGFRNLTH